MHQRRQVINLQLSQLLDGVLLFLSLWVTHFFRFWGTVYFDFSPRIEPFSEFIWLGLIFALFGPLLLELQGFYKLSVSKPLLRSVSQVVRAGMWLFVILAACVIFFRWKVPSRSVLLMGGVVGACVLILREQIAVWWLARQASRGHARERVIVAGLPEEVAKFKQSLTPELLVEMLVVAEVNIEVEPIERLVDLLHEHAVSRVIFTGGRGQLERIQQGIGACETEGIEAWLVADFIKTSIARPDFDDLQGHPMLVFRATPDISWELLAKGVLDRVVSLLGLILLFPLFVFVAVVIKVTSPGPVFFRQLRGGRYGHPFRMWKFRSMHTDAEMRREDLEAHNVMSGPVFKLEQDPRITKFGYFIRRTSIDELPQLMNVLAGEMSLVGPRPLPVYEVEKIEVAAQRRRLSVKPGLTCLWQIGGRNEVKSFEDWVQLDLRYIDNWSLWLDLKILLLTIPAVLRGSGAK